MSSDSEDEVPIEEPVIEEIKEADDTVEAVFKVDEILKQDSTGNVFDVTCSAFDYAAFPKRPIIAIPPSDHVIFTPCAIKENTRDQYELHLFGTSTDGQKIMCTLEGLPVTFDILVNSSLVDVGTFQYITDDAEVFKYTDIADLSIMKKLNDTNARRNYFIRQLREHLKAKYDVESNVFQLCSAYGVDFVYLQAVLEELKKSALNAIEQKNLGVILGIQDDEVNKNRFTPQGEQAVKTGSGFSFKYGSNNITCTITNIFANHPRVFEPSKVLFKRLTFTTIPGGASVVAARKGAIEVCNAAGLSTFNNDKSTLVRKMAREFNLPLNDPAMFPAKRDTSDKAALCKLPAYRVHYTELKQCDESVRRSGVVMAFDIETISYRPGNPLPDTRFELDNIFSMSCSFHYIDEVQPFKQVIIQDLPTAPDARWDTYVCHSYQNIIACFAKIIESMSPDIIIGFNDSQYDWDMFMQAAYKFGILHQVAAVMSPFQSMTKDNHISSILRVLDKYNIPYSDFKKYKTGQATNLSVISKMTGCTDEESQLITDDLFPIRGILDTMNGVHADIPPRRVIENNVKNGTITADQRDQILKFKPIVWKYFGGTSVDAFKKYAKYFYREAKIKISAESGHLCKIPVIDGTVCIDVRVCFMKIYPKDETGGKSSLNSYLKLEKMDTKFDLPYVTMWKYYRAAKINYDAGRIGAVDGKNMRIIANYCMIDSQRCQELMLRRNLYTEFAEVCKMAYVPYTDAYYVANGIKVRNLLAHEALHVKNMFINMCLVDKNEEGKYPGAYVVHPTKGLSPDPELMRKIAEFRGSKHTVEQAKAFIDANSELYANSRPLTGEDFSSLYPSIMMAYNLSPEKIVRTRKQLDEILAKYPTLKYRAISFKFNGRDISAYSIWHENIKENIGLYPTILITLFNKRKDMKVGLKKNEMIIEVLEKVLQNEGSDKLARYRATTCNKVDNIVDLLEHPEKIVIPPGSTINDQITYFKAKLNYLKAVIAVLDDVAVDDAIEHKLHEATIAFATINTKQNALKVFMNTFYGEAGNSKSPAFLLELAGGITSAGQFNIKMVKDFVESLGYLVKYGDTDSLYISCPNVVYLEEDIKYLMDGYTTDEYFTALVNITMRELSKLGNMINSKLEADNGTAYLKMAYEEVLFPVALATKKKYWAIAHVGEVNFKPKKLFIRGIDIIKQGMSELAKSVGYKIMWRAMDINNQQSLYDITINEFKSALAATYPIDYFKLSMPWKPFKNNVAAQTFVSRMRQRATKDPTVHIPEDGERINFVIVKQDEDQYFTAKGKYNDLMKGERMEYVDVATTNGLTIDVNYYFRNSISGLCARFVNGDPMFEPDEQLIVEAAMKLQSPTTSAADDRFKAIDLLSQKSAKAHLEELLVEPDKKAKSKEYKKIYTLCYKRICTDIQSQVPTDYECIAGETLDFTVFSNIENEVSLIGSYVTKFKSICVAYDFINEPIVYKHDESYSHIFECRRDKKELIKELRKARLIYPALDTDLIADAPNCEQFIRSIIELNNALIAPVKITLPAFKALTLAEYKQLVTRIFPDVNYLLSQKDSIMSDEYVIIAIRLILTLNRPRDKPLGPMAKQQLSDDLERIIPDVRRLHVKINQNLMSNLSTERSRYQVDDEQIEIEPSDHEKLILNEEDIQIIKNFNKCINGI